MTTSWYKITALAGGVGEIVIYDEIGIWGITAKQFLDDLNGLGDVTTLNVRLNTPGGSVFDGNAIYNALRRHPANVIVTVDGLAASMGSVIAMAGDEIIMPENALMMIHDPSGLVWGTAEDMAKMADALEKMKSGLIAAYRNKTGLPDDEISALMAAETWLTADEAQAKGFADTVDAPVAMAANFDMLNKFTHAPDHIRAQIPSAMSAHNLDRKGPDMATLDKTDTGADNKLPDITAEMISTDHTAIADHFRAEGSATGAAAATDRIKSILDHDEAQGREVQARHIAFDTDMDVEAATAMLKTTPKVDVDASAGEAYIAAAKGDETATATVSTTATATGDSDASVAADAPLKDRCEAAWAKDANLRAEYGEDNFGAYLAYEQAVAGGKVKILNTK